MARQATNKRAIAQPVTQESNELETMSIGKFAKTHGYVQINKTIGYNENGYPFATFIDRNNEAENIYFSKNAAADLDGQETIEDLAQFVKDYRIAEVINADGESRIKLVGVGGNRLSLEDIFDDED